MGPIALARKWRPRTFSTLVGQTHVNKALIKSLNQQRLHHAYLFSGSHGIGKTSIARLLAKSLNCEQGISANPCLQCDACQAIEQGRFIDLLEIDGASRTRVEDIRDILENVQYTPATGRYKIYLIDEVHMPSQHGFNALLKTLEEPPSHIIFILATTDPQKLPVTVLSRCLQFNLKPLSTEIIAQHIEYLLKEEQVDYDNAAITLMAHAANGSMRDALSLLDQAIATCEGSLKVEEIQEMLGHTKQDYALQLLTALAEQLPEQLIMISRNVAAEGGNFQYVLSEMLQYLHQIAIHKSLPADSCIPIANKLLILLTQFKEEDIQLYYQIALKGLEEIHLAPTQLISFEMTILRMYTFKPTSRTKMPDLAYQQSPCKPEPKPIEQTKKPLPPATATLADAVNPSWHDVLQKLKLSGLTSNAAEHAELIEKKGTKIILRVAHQHESLFTTNVTHQLETALSHYYGETIKVTCEFGELKQPSFAQEKKQLLQKQQENAEKSLQEDPLFKQLQQEFSAELVKNSIAPVKDDL